MSSQYPQYQYQQYPQYGPPGTQLPAGSGIGDQPGTGAAAAPPAFVPLPSDMTVAEMHSQQLTAIAAGKQPAELGVKNPAADPPADFPFLMYNAKDGTTKAAKDEKEKGDLAGKGYSENPPKPDPNAVTPEMLQALQAVWIKAGEELKRLTQLVDQQQKQMEAAGNVLGAGQQPQYPTSGYPQTGD